MRAKVPGYDKVMKTGSTPGAVQWQREKQGRSRPRRLSWFDDGISTELRDEPRAFVVYALRSLDRVRPV